MQETWHSPPPRGAPKIIWPAILMVIAILVAVGGAILFMNLPNNLASAGAIGVLPALLVMIAILRSPYFGLLLIYFFLYVRPQDIITALRPLHLPLLTTLGLCLLVAINIMRSRERKVLWPAGMTTFAILVGLLGVGVIASYNNYWAFQYMKDMTVTILMVFLTINLATSFAKLNGVLSIMIGAHFIFCLKGLKQYLSGNIVGTTGTVGSDFMGDENDFALTLIVIFPFIFFNIQRARSRRKKLFWLCLATLVLVTAMATMSRGGFLGMSAALFFCWAVSSNKLRNAGAILFIVLIVGALSPERYISEIKSIRNTREGTANLRMEYWLAGMRMYAEFPLIGVGQGNSGNYLPTYIDLPNPDTKWGRAMHGTLPLLLAELGTIGFLIYAVLFFQCARYLRRILHYPVDDPVNREHMRYYAHSTTAAAIGFMVSATFLSALYYPHIYVLAGITMTAHHLAVIAATRSTD